MNTKYLKTLEFDKIIEKLTTYCKTYIGKNQVANLLPSFDHYHVADLLEITSEATSLVYRKGNIPLADLPNIELSIKSLDSGATLSISALLSVARFLKISREVKEYFSSNDDIDLSAYPKLTDIFEVIYTNKNIEDKILSVILDENTIADNASSKLSSIRRQAKKLEQDIRDKLNSFIHSSTYSKYIMEPIITIRENRYVLPIKEEYKSQVKGFIHDVSSSGSTVFMEPISVFDLNSEIANLKIEEEIEIERILSELSSLLYDYTIPLKGNISILGELDLIFAKASYSLEIDGICPKINEEKYINFLQAKHPLIDKNVVVPIDISIGKDYTSLVITGPNTGGKTVALKTTGLLLLMAYSGIYIPAKEGSSIYVFDNIFVDIGDEQSIQENLSTFSSHISNIVEITNNITSNSLVLVDELGSGTDPIEGANLAISILEYINNANALTICTTHYQELKNYCLTHTNFKNASFEFDLDNLKPTYKLLIGIPGKSNAFAISKKLGLKEEILKSASSLMRTQDISIEELMKNIYDSKLEIEKEKEEIQKNSNQIETLRKSLEARNNIQKEKQAKILDKAREEAKQILQSAKDEANSVIRKLNNLGKNDLASANNLRNELNDKLKDLNSDSSNDGINLESLLELNSKFSLRSNELSYNMLNVVKNPRTNNEKLTSSNSQVNNSISYSTEIENNNTNNQKTNTKASNHSSVTFAKNSQFKAQHISSEINVIGQTVDEAIFVIDKYLDDCAIAKLSTVRIVHGKGTGKLREGIHKFLKTNPHVKSFRLGTFGEGEMGVTVVELK